MSKKYLAIDLGTSNSSLSYYAEDSLKTHDIEQTESKAKTFTKKSLASCVYIPREDEFNEADLALSFSKPKFLVGEFAKSHGALNPQRFVIQPKLALSEDSKRYSSF